MQTCFPVSNIFTWYISSLIMTVNTVSPIRLSPCHEFHGKWAVNITLAFHLTPMAEPSATNKEKASPINVSKAKTATLPIPKNINQFYLFIWIFTACICNDELQVWHFLSVNDLWSSGMVVSPYFSPQVVISSKEMPSLLVITPQIYSLSPPVKCTLGIFCIIIGVCHWKCWWWPFFV